MTKKNRAELVNSPGRLKTGYSRTGKVAAGRAGAAGRYKTAIEPIEVKPDVFKNPKTGDVHWDIVEQMFVEGWPTNREEVRYWPNLKELSTMTGLSYQRLQNKSSANRWYQLQQTMKNSVVTERKKRRIETLTNLSFDFDDLQLEVASRGSGMVLRRMDQIDELVAVKEEIFQKNLERLKDGEELESEDLRTGLYHAEMEALAKAASAFQEIGMKALGTDKERIELSSASGTISMHQVSVSDELGRDDPSRIASFMQTYIQIQELNKPEETNIEEAESLIQIEASNVVVHYDEDDVVDAEVIEVEDAT